MDTNDRTILRRLILVLVVAILIGVVVWVFFIRGDNKKAADTQNATSTSQTSNGTAAQTDTGNKPASGQPSAQAQGNAQAGGGAAATQNQTQPQTQNKQTPPLANAGPEDVVGVFVGTVIVGAVLHHLYLRRRQSSTA